MEPRLAIPDFDLLRLLGRGGFGEVWLARSRSGVCYAVKILSSADSSEVELEGLRAYQRHVRGHPHLIDVLHVGEERGVVYYVMDLADPYPTQGTFDPLDYEPRTLAGDLRRRGRLAFRETADAVRQVLAGLRHLHSHDLLHRDLKPANVLHAGGGWKIGDVGLVTRSTRRLHEGRTASYSPPEGVADRSGDLYSLGKVLFEAATGTPPERFPELPSGAEPELLETARRLAPIIDRACAPDPKERYARCEDFEHDLQLAVGPGVGSCGRLGPYRLTGVLGEGAVGIVYAAEQLEPIRREVAVKVVKAGMDTRSVIARFEAERQALALLDHPNVARVHEAGAAEDGRPYFAMERVKGLPITEHCDLHRLSLATRVELFVQVCRGVQHAHARGILHRDLKPTNVLVASTEAGPAAKIIDFGFAAATSQHLTEKSLSLELGKVVGTPAYMSPEQAGLEREVDARADVYSLGVLLHEILTGVLPSHVEDLGEAAIDEVLRRIRDDEPVPPGTRWQRLSDEARRQAAEKRSASPGEVERSLRGDLGWIVMKAIERERGRRYASAADLAADLERALRGETSVAGPPTWTRRLGKYVGRNRAAAVVVFAVAAACIACFGFYLRSERRLEDVLSLADVRNLKEFEDEARDLWPASYASVPRLEAWLVKARGLAERLPLHRERLERLRRSGNRQGGGWKLPDERDQWWHDTLASLVEGLERFTDPNPFQGALASVTRRLDFARDVKARTIDSVREKWDEAIASIADRGQCPKYQGEVLRPQEGLIPIGRDSSSGLWEFRHIASDLVLVLVPGGEFEMGSAAADPAVPRNERPAHPVRLDSFFISKREMTQAQWIRAAGENPSDYTPDCSIARNRQRITLDHPVENVSWEQCREVLRRLGLDLPTEAQWEYAARAGTRTRWWTGDERDSLIGAANLADHAAKRAGAPWDSADDWPDFNDGYYVHAPAGAFRANAFGLHDVAGNVGEWCRDRQVAYDSPVRAGDGERTVSAEAAAGSDRIFRGGSFTSRAWDARSAARRGEYPGFRRGNLGVRPARAVER